MFGGIYDTLIALKKWKEAGAPPGLLIRIHSFLPKNNLAGKRWNKQEKILNLENSENITYDVMNLIFDIHSFL